MDWKPPRTREELDTIQTRIEQNSEYFARIKQFVRNMKLMEPYTLDRFVKPENMDLFKDCICLLIARQGYPLEFDNTYSKIRRY
ncbi:MAG: hypothetical protein K2L50_07355 [Bacteroidales bacterium]|nr:hypothetical protein [Bacteroidales bacterium]